jgi:hypothetical protein
VPSIVIPDRLYSLVFICPISDSELPIYNGFARVGCNIIPEAQWILEFFMPEMRKACCKAAFAAHKKRARPSRPGSAIRTLLGQNL